MFTFKKGNEKKLEGKALFYLDLAPDLINSLDSSIAITLPVYPAVYAGQKKDLETYIQEFPYINEIFTQSHAHPFEIKNPNFWYILTHFSDFGDNKWVSGDIIHGGPLADLSESGLMQIKDRLEYLAKEYMEAYAQQQREKQLRGAKQPRYTRNIKNYSAQDARIELYNLVGCFLDAVRKGSSYEEISAASNFHEFFKGSSMEKTAPFILALAKNAPSHLEALSTCIECMVATHEGDTTRAYEAFEKLKKYF